MAVTLTYDSTLGRVQIDATGLGAADTALVERSTDQVVWTTVRGAEAWPVTAGAFALTLDDYEFSPDVANWYQVSGMESGAVTFVAAGAGTNGNNTSLVPALPAGIVAGDLLLIAASIRNSGTGTVNTPAGWDVVRTFGNLTVLGRRYVSGDAAPTVTFTGGVAGADTLARMCAFRRASLVPITGVDLLNGSAQDIDYPALTVPDNDLTLIDVAWKQDDYSGATARAGFTSIGGVSATAGDDAAMSWWYQIQTASADLTSGTHTITGGAAAISRAMVIALEHAVWLQQQQASITPTIGDVWLKSIARPFLNTAVQVVLKPTTQISRPARATAFDIIGRSYPIAVSDIRSGRTWTMYVRTETQGEADWLSLLFASGDILYIQAPAGAPVETGYVMVGPVDEQWHPLRHLHKLWVMPLTLVAAPGPDVVGASLTWTTVINTWPLWSDLVVDEASWATLLGGTGSPSEIIVA